MLKVDIQINGKILMKFGDKIHEIVDKARYDENWSNESKGERAICYQF